MQTELQSTSATEREVLREGLDRKVLLWLGCRTWHLTFDKTKDADTTLDPRDL